jgi:transcriptional regulator GlxA family with amidase domain
MVCRSPWSVGRRVGWERTIERRFREELGCSPADELTRMRIERLKRLLVESKTPIRRLAGNAGFHGPRRMCAVFKRAEGVTPSAYRRSRRL